MKKIFLISILTWLTLNTMSQQPSFIWPVKAAANYSEVTDFYTVNNYVDQDNSNITPCTTCKKDWDCKGKTYDGHHGIDIDLWPFSWSMKDNNYVNVVAAADGRVVTVLDFQSNDDNSISDNTDNCGINPSPNLYPNFIGIRHSDNSTSFYMHIKRGSAIVRVNDIVTVGQIIATPGSSGNSSHPHLHFEVYNIPIDTPNFIDKNPAGLIDPYNSGIVPAGSNCNLLNTGSWWQNQKPHDEPGIVRVMTHYDIPFVIDDNVSSATFCKTAEKKKHNQVLIPEILYTSVLH